ncbi:MAG: hypothetical protein AMXMBFR46_05200 [Acidimicrobiia bacterium]
MSDNEPNTELELAGAEIDVPGDAALAEELAAERSVWRSVVIGILVAVPVCMLIWVAMVAIAVGPEDPEHWLAWLGMGALVGSFAGAFFGGWAAFTMKAHLLDDIDRRGAHH